jgi:hypothetical protein
MSGRRSKKEKKKQRHMSEQKPAETLSKLKRIEAMVRIAVSLAAFALMINPHVSLSPLAPLDHGNVVPKFTLANTGNLPLEEVSTECILNGSGLRNVHIRNAKINPNQGPMMFDNIPAGARVSTSCAIRATDFSEGTTMQIRNRYKLRYLKFPGLSDSYFRLVHDSEGKPRWDPDAASVPAL